MRNLQNFKFIQIGLGSMGKRRIRNLLFHGISKENIIGFDIQSARNKEARRLFGISTVETFPEGLKKYNPDVFFISTPPNTHYPYFLHAAKNKKHFFTEHPTTHKGYSELYKLMDGSFVGVPSCTLRFHPAIKKIKKIVLGNKIGKVLSFQYHMGQYLPDWHPWEDYRDVYFSKKETGACREMFAFELTWLSDIFGFKKIKQVNGLVKKLSGLKMTADDYYSAQVVSDDNLMGSMVIDLLARSPFRTLRIIGTEGVLDWEWQQDYIRIFQVKTKTWQHIHLKRGKSEKNYVTTEDMYESEVGAFLSAIKKGTEYPLTFQENHKFLKALFALEESSKRQRSIRL